MIDRSRDAFPEFDGTRNLEKSLFVEFQSKIGKYTGKLVRRFDDGNLKRNLKRFKILDNMRCDGKKENRRPSKVLKSAVASCLRRIINSILKPYLSHCYPYNSVSRVSLLKSLIAFVECKDSRTERQGKPRLIGNGNGKPSSWPSLFLVMANEWIPIIYQFMKYDLSPNEKGLNVERLRRKIKRFGLTLSDEDSEYVCNRIMILN